MNDLALNTPSISAVIVNHNGGKNILKSVQALFDQGTPLAEIIVVDNASQDGSPEILAMAHPSVNLIRLQENLGLSAARNLGIEAVSSDLVLILDDDIYLQVDTVELLIACLVSTEASIVCPRILLFPQTNIVQCDGASPHFIGNMTLLHAYRPSSEEIPADCQEVGAVIGACILADVRAVRSNGSFNPDYFFYFEDLEFSLRMRALGHKIFCQPDAKVLHDKGEGTPGLSFRGTGEYPSKRLFYTLRHRWLTIALIYQGWTIFVLSLPLLIYEFAALAMIFKNRQVNIWRQALRSLFEIRGKIRTQRAFIQTHRVIGDQGLLQSPPLFFAPGFITSRPADRAVTLLSGFYQLYWKLFSRLLKK